MNALASDLRRRLESTIQDARAAAEDGASQALEALAVGRAAFHEAMNSEEKVLRNRLRAHGRQLGDVRQPRGEQAIDRLRHEIAYEHWHRMLFARFLAENDLLIEPSSGVAVSLDECRELARGRGEDPWALAASFAERMLPRIFRSDDPALEVTLPPETRQRLRTLLSELPSEVFIAADALGWTYQFWQNAEKKSVNARRKSGEKITGRTLPAVTQLFTEPYMVQFLLHNTLGAWHAGKLLAQDPELAASAASEQELSEAVALDGYTFDYLRFVRSSRDGDEDGRPTGPWRPAAGSYATWPAAARDVTVLDPCCGSGHFLVAAFDVLVRLRRAEEGLALDDACRAVLTDNVFGLELDPRCTQIAAFHLAFAAWRLAGSPIDLPALNIACSGIGPEATKEEWLSLAEAAAAKSGMSARKDLFGSEDSLLSSSLKTGLTALHEQFALAPELGSLVDPRATTGDLFTADYDRLEPLLESALAAETNDEELHERAVAAHGMARAARILTGTYTLVITNVPYLGRGDQGEILRAYAESHHKEAKSDLATLFVSRMLRWIESNSHPGTIAAVTPQNWLFLTSYKKFRTRLLKELTWEMVVRLGPGAFETISGHVVNVALLSLSGVKADGEHAIAGLDALSAVSPGAKAALLRRDGAVILLPQGDQRSNPDACISFAKRSDSALTGEVARSFQGVKTGDDQRFRRHWWEVPASLERWRFYQTTVDATEHWAGLLYRIDAKDSDRQWARPQGKAAWGRSGVAISQMSNLPVALYSGEVFDSNMSALVPTRSEDVPALWCLCSDESFCAHVRTFDQSLKVPNGTFEKLSYDPAHWERVAATKYARGLPEPQSNDPTQWIFHGHPAHADLHSVLHVAVARLLGCRWPPELDGEMRLAEEARLLVDQNARFDQHRDEDGIVCLAALQGEAPAAARLRAVLADAYGAAWSAAQEQDVLRAAGEHFHKGRVQRSLDVWLRDRFFVEHVSLFHRHPFIWHVWDGHPDGFGALVNYHRLAGPDGEGLRTLEALTFTYLGAWITRQRQQAAAAEEGAEGRLAAALVLDAELRKIIEGEPPYDLFVRWKPLHKQPLGWHPDVNDGVRLNIRPFLMARDVKTKGAGILRARPNATWCNSRKLGVRDRGKEPDVLRPREPYPWFWGCDPEAHPEHRIDFGAETSGASRAGADFDGTRWNGLHYTRRAKEIAMERARVGREGEAAQ